VFEGEIVITLEGRGGRPDRKRDQSITVLLSGTVRFGGFQQMVRSGNILVFAWTGHCVLTATMPLP